MSNLILFIMTLVLFSACASQPQSIPSNVKAFEAEDRLAIFALYAKSKGDANSTIALYNTLYERSGKLEYRNEELLMMIQSAQYERALEKVEAYKDDLDRDTIDVHLERFKVLSLIALKRFDAAKNTALALVNFTKSAQDYEQCAAIYMLQSRYEFALRYLESAYAINYDEKILDKMSIILYVNLNRKAEALSYLETHIRLNGCSEMTCMRLASFYSEENDVEGMLRIYTRLYDNTKDDKYVKTIIKLYTYKKDTIGLIQFLEKSGADDAQLLQLYSSTKNYQKVVDLGRKLYKESGDFYYLGQSAIFEYEGAADKQDKKMIDSVMKKLKKVIEGSGDAVYLNYLGYLLIDHDIDVLKGIDYVRRALLVDNESPFYLDSLAWGYYKQGKCKEALDLMGKVRINLGKEDPEVSKHVKEIQICIKKKGN